MHQCQIRAPRVISQGFKLYGQSFIVLLGMSVVTCALNGVTKILNKPPLINQLAALGITLVLLVPIWCWVSLAMIRTCDAVSQGERPGFYKSLANPHGRFWLFMVNSAAITAYILMGALVLGLLVFGALTLIRTRDPVGMVRTALWLSTANELLGVGLAIWFMLRVALYGVVTALETPKQHWSWPLKRSWQLMRGHMWRGVGAWAVPFICSVPGAIVTILAYDNIRTRAIAHWGLYWAGTALSALCWPLYVATGVALYRAIHTEKA